MRRLAARRTHGPGTLLRVTTADGRVVASCCEAPRGSLGRMRGLLGRTGLPIGGGMLLDAAPSVHTAFMRFPIDVVFLDKQRTVVKVVRSLRPWRVASARRAVAALELPAGAVAAISLDRGTSLVLEDIGPKTAP